MLQKITEELMRESVEEMKEKLPFTLTPKDLIELDLLPFKRSKIYELLRQKEIPNRRISGSIVILRDEFLLWLFSDDEETALKDKANGVLRLLD